MSFQAPHSNMKVLVVDDDRAIRSLVTRIASGWDYDTSEAPNAEEALAKLGKERFNIVLTDIKMGKMDGIAFAEKIRETMPSVAVVIMTGNPTPKTAQQSQDMGALYYLQKPLSTDQLGETLRIAAAWNMGMLTDRAARRFLALRKGNERDKENRLKAIKYAIKKLLLSTGWTGPLRDFVYAQNVESNPLFIELNGRFSADSIKNF